MARYFLELSYKGTLFSGFQSQKNANTIQAEVEKALAIIIRQNITLTGSSRTDAGVHALQNFFHFDHNELINSHIIYRLNAILPTDIVIKSIKEVNADSHCRFDALSREYNYYIYSRKDPFLKETAYYYPYKLNVDAMYQAALLIKGATDFTSFSKRNTQVKTFICKIMESQWVMNGDTLIYNVKANRFLRGMVRALTATMLKVGTGKLQINEFQDIINAKDCTKASFAVPPHGLFLIKVDFDDDKLVLNTLNK